MRPAGRELGDRPNRVSLANCWRSSPCCVMPKSMNGNPCGKQEHCSCKGILSGILFVLGNLKKEAAISLSPQYKGAM